MAWTTIHQHPIHWIKLPKARSSSASSNRRMVLSHGLFVGNLAAWYLSSAQPLSEVGEVLMYDLRGHGKSGFSATGYDLQSLTNDLDGLLAHHEWRDQPLCLIGHSYGGRVMLEWARQNPQLVDQLILVDVPLWQSELPELGLTDIERLTKHPDHQKALLEALPPALRVTLSVGGRRARRALGAWYRLLTETSLCSDLSSEPEVEGEHLSALTDKLWAIYGARSPCMSSATWLSEHLSEPSRIRLIPNAGHYLLNEAPVPLTQALCAQLEERSRG